MPDPSPAIPAATASLLVWANGRGYARHDGITIELRRSPGIFAEVHFASGLQAEVREHASDPKREMTAVEIRQAIQYLDNLAFCIRGAVGQLYHPQETTPS